MQFCIIHSSCPVLHHSFAPRLRTGRATPSKCKRINRQSCCKSHCVPADECQNECVIKMSHFRMNILDVRTSRIDCFFPCFFFVHFVMSNDRRTALSAEHLFRIKCRELHVRNSRHWLQRRRFAMATTAAKKKTKKEEWWHFKWSRTPTRRTPKVPIRYWWARRVCIECGHGIAHIAIESVPFHQSNWFGRRMVGVWAHLGSRRARNACTIPLATITSVHDVDALRYAFIAPVYAKFTSPMNGNGSDIYGVRFWCAATTTSFRNGWNMLSRAKEGKKVRARPAIDSHLTSHTRANAWAINNLQLSCHSAHRNFIFRLAVRTLAKRRRQEMDFIRFFSSSRCCCDCFACMAFECDACTSLLGDTNFSLSLHFCRLHCTLGVRVYANRLDSGVAACVFCGRTYNEGKYANIHLWEISWVNDVISQSNSHLVQVSLNETNRNGTSALCEFAWCVSVRLNIVWWKSRQSGIFMGRSVRVYVPPRTCSGVFFFDFSTLWLRVVAHFLFCGRSRTHKQLNRNKFMRLSYSRLNSLKWNFTVAANIAPEILSSTSSRARHTIIYSELCEAFDLINLRRST